MSQNNSPNNKRIAKNAVLLYLRMGMTVLVGLYTSRVVLRVLGVEDYGIYGVVGGIVALLDFLKGSMSGATSRFITFELGTGNTGKLKATFMSAVWVHVIISIAIIVLAETVGLWFLYNKLVIPDGRMTAAFWVFQFSIIASFFSVTQVPYDSTIMAHEDLDFLAYVEMGSAISKLGIVFLLQCIVFDKLILYAFLYACVIICTILVKRCYCKKHYIEAQLVLRLDKTIVKKMLSFSFWDLFGTFSINTKIQGRIFLLNMFFGVAVNAAATVANSLAGSVMNFTWAIVQPFRPQIIKQYATGNIKQMEDLAASAVKYSLLLISTMMIPVLIETKYIFTLWLGTVPEHSVEFCRLIIIYSYLHIALSIPMAIIQATGYIKRLNMTMSICYLSVLGVTYILFSIGFSSIFAYIVDVIGGFVMFELALLLSKFNIKELNTVRLNKELLISVFAMLPGAILCLVIVSFLDDGFLRLLLITISYIIVTATVSYIFVLDKKTRLFVVSKLKSCVTSLTLRK